MVELVGPSGSGKSTLLGELGRLDPRLASDLTIRKRRYLFPLALFGLRLAPAAAGLYRDHGRHFHRFHRELGELMYLDTLRLLVRRHCARAAVPLVLDQGPVFRLAHLHAFGDPAVRQGSQQGRWEARLGEWGQLLDGVVWLDAPDDLLRARIRSREQWHRVKERDDESMDAFLQRYRESYEHLLGRLREVNPRLRLLRIDSSRLAVPAIVGRVRQFLAAGESE